MRTTSVPGLPSKDLPPPHPRGRGRRARRSQWWLADRWLANWRLANWRLAGWLLLVCLAACAGGAQPSPAQLLAQAEPGQVTRLVLDGDRVVAVAAPIDYRQLPPLARTTCDAIAPDGELQFCGWESGARGRGFRVDKAYVEPVEHVRSLLIDSDGTVLERSHTVPLTNVPDHVLATALERGSFVESAEIVSGPEREEYWLVVIRDRQGFEFVCQVDLDGAEMAVRRRVQSRVDS